MVGGADECKTWKDCVGDGKQCDSLQDAVCICKKGQCKISGKRKYKKTHLQIYIPQLQLCIPSRSALSFRRMIVKTRVDVSGLVENVSLRRVCGRVPKRVY